MDGLHCKPGQFHGLETKANEEALEERAVPNETWSKNSNKAAGPVRSSEGVVEDSAISIPLLGLILKTPASLEPVCFADSPIILPVEVQLAGGVEPLTIATPVITPTPGCLTLPLIFDQPHKQHLSPLASCPVTEQQNLLCSLQQNNGLPLPMCQSQSDEGKSNICQPSENTAMHGSEFSPEAFPILRNYSSSPYTSFPLNAFPAGYIPPTSTTLSHFYSGSPVLPPATLLVPFPFVLPLPVPLPIPIPIPIPIPNFPGTSSFCRACHTMKTSKSTQTMTEGIPVHTNSRMSGRDFLQLPTQASHLVSQEQVLDLTVKVVPIQTKQEVQFSFRQDNVLDLSAASKSCLETGKDSKLKHRGRNSTKEDSTKSILAVNRSPTQGTHRSTDDADMELSMRYKWITEHYENYALKYSSGFITPKQLPRVAQSAKDTSVVFCEKLARSHSSVVKQKRVNSQNINIHPIKKQHLLKCLPGK